MQTISEVLDLLKNVTNLKVSQSDLAKALTVTRATISFRVKNNSPVTFEERKKIENYFDVKLPLDNDIQEYVNNLASGYAKKEAEKRVISPELKADLQKIYDEGIDLNWFILGKGNKYRAPEFEQVKDELARRMEKMENALKNAGILTD